MKIILSSAFMVALCLSCSQKSYEVSGIQAQRYPLVAADYASAAPEMSALITKYKTSLDKEMNQVIGTSDQDMPYGRPESLLTNLTSDVMLAYGKKYNNGVCDLSSVNVFGHRADLGKGNITVGNIFEIYPFENTLILLKLKGSDLMEAFESYAKIGGAGISSTVKLVIKDEKLVSATVNGESVDPNKVYTIMTLDYLADGNDGMEAFRKATELIEPGLTLRDMMMQYVKDQTAQGKSVSSVLDGRITIEK